ncbi:MAG TPA: thioesterase family protein [Gammaproteobacteria bacterium]|jgi:acyl-CoA thioester hydrolase|nr:thioesterase family protein [Gammaproteobacteria bacterium]HPI95479.1 thioesterase family protein [Gammaproteobacteria bacterium]HPQ87222.1 thioesterase family protein [Gammaproteobacteria bacterium]
MNHLKNFEKKYPVIIDLKVQWGDMDAFNHVNNIMYFRYFESARIAFFEQIGDMEMKPDKVAPILAETSCRYKFPLTYPDTIKVGARVIENQEFGFLMEYAVYSEKHSRVTSIGTGRIVMLDYTTHEKVKVPEKFLAKIAAMQNTDID